MPQGRFHQDQTGKKYGMLTLVQKLDERSKNSSFKYLVKCDCGNEAKVAFSQMSSGKTKSCGCKSRLKGPENHNWKHGRSKMREYYNEGFMRVKYGVTPEKYNEMVESQGDVCAICKTKPNFDKWKKRFVIDHCHATGLVRGLLCDACNRGIGMLKDDPSILMNAIDYINSSRAR
jgi:hypothetical protein